jgi:glycosyltransferase involved in cell wall biosynthesis
MGKRVLNFPVDILLATYNGAAYLEEQLNSLLHQDYPHCRIIARDDGSTDDTPAILKKYAEQFPDKITLISDDRKNLGPTGNFNALMMTSAAPFICFSDQDDWWMPVKVSDMLWMMIRGGGLNTDKPMMVFHDLMYCDEQLNIIHTSLNQKDHLNPRLISTNRLLMQNVPYGCAMMINRALLESATPIPQEALLHDHWLALCASLTGGIGYLEKSLVKHRVHDANASRAKSEHKQAAGKDLGSKITNRNFHQYLFKQAGQAAALLTHYGESLNAQQKEMLMDFVKLKSTSGLERKALILKHRFFKNRLIHTLKLLVRT